MIVVIGTVCARVDGASFAPDGFAAAVALAITTAGEPTELVGKVGVDPAGEAVIAKLAAAGVGHVALIRDGARPTALREVDSLEMDAADLQLALRYLTSFDAVLLVDPINGAVIATVSDACAYVGARLVVTRPEGSPQAVVRSGERGSTPPPLEVERPGGNPAAVTELLVALLLPDRESPAT